MCSMPLTHWPRNISKVVTIAVFEVSQRKTYDFLSKKKKISAWFLDPIISF